MSSRVGNLRRVETRRALTGVKPVRGTFFEDGEILKRALVNAHVVGGARHKPRARDKGARGKSRFASLSPSPGRKRPT